MDPDNVLHGQWTLAIFYSAFVIMYAYSFVRPTTVKSWLSLAAFSIFVVTVYVERYGVALTRDALTEWLQSQYQRLTLVSYIFLGFGFYLLSTACGVWHLAQRQHALATTGPYAVVRHPQYVAFVLILLGFLVQWPSLTTLLMFPALLLLYRYLALTEEAGMHAQFGPAFDRYAEQTPRFMPSFFGRERM
jgi:protein-S-isoprenylcysteine O-methyltransferase Ste14